MITVVNKTKHLSTPHDVFVGRGSPLGNVYDFKGSSHPQVKHVVSTRLEAVQENDKHLQKSILDGDPEICDAINELIIKHKKGEPINLVCYCAPNFCHADNIQRYVEESRSCVNWFSNMRRMDEPLRYQGINFWTTEAFYQAMKIRKTNVELRQEFALKSPFKAKIDIRKVDKSLLEDNYDDPEKKIVVMEYALRHKFARETSWGQKLLAYNKEIIEWNNWGDVFWGKNIFTGEGENHLGRILMKIKEEIS